MLSIGKLSQLADVKIPTIRYYEKIGLLSQPMRSDGNQRRYAKRELERLSFIRHARDLGLSIEAIRELIELSNHPEMPCVDADRIARQHLNQVKQRITLLRNLETELERIVAGCDANQIGECYVIKSLADHTLCQIEHSVIKKLTFADRQKNS